MTNKFLIGLGVATLLGAINKNNKNKNNNSRSKKKNKVELEEKYFIDQFNRVHKIKFSQKLIDVIKKGAYLVIDNAVFKLYHGPDDKLYLRSFILDKNYFKELNEGKEISIADHKFRIFVNKKNNKRIIGCAYKNAKKLRGGFSETTSASFSVDAIGAVDGGSDTTEATTFTYDYGIDLSTSFTGEDSFDISIDAGGSGAGSTDIDATAFDSSGDALNVDGINYTFPVGGTTMIVGDSTDISASFTGACTYSSFTDYINDCGTGSSIGAGGAGASAGLSYAFDSGFSLAGGVSSPETGIMSGADDAYGLDAAYTGDSYGVSVAYTADDADAGASASTWAPYYATDLPSLSVGYETADTGTGAGAEGYFAGLSFPEVGPGSVSIGAASTDFDDAASELYAYGLSYEYPVNDGMTIKPFSYDLGAAEDSSGDDLTGIEVKTTFKF